MAVVGDDRRVGHQHPGAHACRPPGGDQAGVLVAEAPEHGQEGDAERRSRGDRDHLDGARVTIQRRGREQRHGRQGWIEVAVAAGVNPKSDKGDRDDEVRDRRQVDESPGSAGPAAPDDNADDLVEREEAVDDIQLDEDILGRAWGRRLKPDAA